MSLPKEGSRDVYEGIIVSIMPDVCLTPAGSAMVPVPYTIWCRQADAANLAKTLRLSDDRAHAKSSVVVQCFGDEPGTGGGVDSSTTGAECTPMTWSPTVRVEDRNVVRHTDLWWMNHRNTFGRLSYTKDLEPGEAAPTRSIDPAMEASYQVASATPQPGGGPPKPVLPPSMIDPDYEPPPRSPPAPPSSPPPGETPYIPGYPGLRDPQSPPQPGEPAAPVEEPSSEPEAPGIGRRPRLGTAAKAGLWAAAAIALDAWVRSSRKQLKDCCIAPYFINGAVLGGGAGGCAACKKGQLSAAHHGMVDYPFRTGGASNSKYRAPSVPSYRNALTVCVSPATHDKLHRDFEADSDLNSARSTAKIPGTVTFDDVKKASENGIFSIPDNELSTDCKYLYKILLEQQYRPGGDTLMRGNPNAPTPETDSDPSRLDALKKSWGIR